MDPRPILDNGIGPDPLPTDSPQREWPGTRNAAEPPAAGEVRFPGEDGGKSLAAMAQRDLVATLQLLAERAQYITGATGAAIALRDGEEMTCRASAGTSAPGVGAHLQVDSGLSGESVRTMKTLRCDDAASDPRVNRESCEALGIASVVVMPLVRENDVIGVFELFSDKPNVFDARDITALERMGAMVFTALEHALAAFQADAKAASPAVPGEQHAVGAETVGVAASAELHQTPDSATAEAARAGARATLEATPTGEVNPSHPVESRMEATEVPTYSGIAFHMRAPVRATPAVPNEADDVLEVATEAVAAGPPGSRSMFQEELLGTASLPKLEPEIAEGLPEIPQPRFETEVAVAAAEMNPEGQTAPRSAVANLRRCEGCGFPVSEGRQLCLDCERKRVREQGAAESMAPAAPMATGNFTSMPRQAIPERSTPVREPMPQFLREEQQESSWLANHKYMVGAIAVAVAGIVILLLAR